MSSPPDSDVLLRSIDDAIQGGGVPVHALDDRRYVEAHRAFEQASTQQSQIRQHLEAEATQLIQSGRSPLSVLSVGCGCGMLDRSLLAHLSDHIDTFVGVDPNPTAVAHCKQMLSSESTLPPTRIECARFEDFQSDRRYDFIYCSHVFYYVDDRAAAFQQMCSLLRDRGTLVIAHAPKTAMNALAQVFWSEHEQADFFDDDLHRLIEAHWPSPAASHPIAAGIPRTLFSDDTPQGTLLLEFLIQAEWTPLPSPVKDRVQSYIDRHSQSLPNGGSVLPHPATTFTLRRTHTGEPRPSGADGTP